MKASFRQVMKCFLKSVPGISFLTHKGYLSGGVVQGFLSGGLCPDTMYREPDVVVSVSIHEAK